MFSACKDDDDITNADIIGVWVEERETGDGEEVINLGFNDKGEYSLWVTWPEFIDHGYYKVSSSSISFMPYNQKTYTESIRLKKDKLYIGEIVYIKQPNIW